MHLKELYKLAVTTPGRRILSLREVQQLAKAWNLPHVVAHIDKMIEHDLMTRGLNMQWLAVGSGKSAHAPDMPVFDGLADRLITGVRDGARLFALGADQATVLDVENFLDTAFPAGVHAVTSLPYVEEAAEIERILGMLQGPLAGQVARFGLTHLVERLAAVLVQYRDALHASQGIDFATVRAARDKGHLMLLQVVSMIVGAYPLDTPEHEHARGQLLGPILEQDAAIRAYCRRNRRPAPDIDPDTGEISDPVDDAAPAAE